MTVSPDDITRFEQLGVVVLVVIVGTFYGLWADKREHAGQPVIEFEREKDGRWICEYSLIPGAMAYGETPEKALLNVATIIRQEVQGDQK